MMPVDVSQFPNELFITSIPTISVVAFFQDCAIPPHVCIRVSNKCEKCEAPNCCTGMLENVGSRLCEIW